MASDRIQGPPLSEIIKKNWDLFDFISDGYLNGSDLYIGNRLRGGRKVPQLILKGDDPEVMRTWAREIDPEIEAHYSRQGWKRFRDDLLLIHSNPGRLFLSGEKYSSWYQNGNSFIIIISDETFGLYVTDKFEDVFFNMISTKSRNLEIVQASKLEEPYISALDVLYTQQEENVEEILDNLKGGKLIEIKGFPIEMSISPLVEMTNGLFFMNNSYEFILIGLIVDKHGEKKPRAEVYDYVDGQRLISSLSLDENKWYYAVVKN